MPNCLRGDSAGQSRMIEEAVEAAVEERNEITIEH